MLFTLCTILWPMLNFSLHKNYHKIYDNHAPLLQNKIVRNFSSAINGGVFILTSFLYLLTGWDFLFRLSLYAPLTYYTWDTHYIILNKKTREQGLVYHHLITILLTNFTLYKCAGYESIYWAYLCIELSNFAIYSVYHLINVSKRDNDSQLELLTYKLMQLGWYGFFRIVVCTYMLYYHLNKINVLLKLSSLLIYVLGGLWFSKQVVGFRKNLNEYIKTNGDQDDILSIPIETIHNIFNVYGLLDKFNEKKINDEIEEETDGEEEETDGEEEDVGEEETDGEEEVANKVETEDSLEEKENSNAEAFRYEDKGIKISHPLEEEI